MSARFPEVFPRGFKAVCQQAYQAAWVVGAVLAPVRVVLAMVDGIETVEEVVAGFSIFTIKFYSLAVDLCCLSSCRRQIVIEHNYNI